MKWTIINYTLEMKTVSSVLTVILLLYSVPAGLSGLDILKGSEPDLSTELVIVSIYFSLSIVYCVVNLAIWLKQLRASR